MFQKYLCGINCVVTINVSDENQQGCSKTEKQSSKSEDVTCTSYHNGNNVIVNTANIYEQVESGETFLSACSEKDEDVSSSTDIETINDETERQTNEFEETQESEIISSGTTKTINDETMAKQLILESEEAQENDAMSVR